MKAPLAGLLAATLAFCACSNDSSSTAPSPTRSSPVTETFESNLVAQGSAWRIVSAIGQGTVTATLTSADQPAAMVDLAIGLKNASGSGCLASKDVVAAAGLSPQISEPVDAGDYCVKISDNGGLTGPMRFTITINYP